MEGFRIVNLILQSTYLLVQFLFILRLLRQRQPSPIWYWFIFLSIALWVWVSGRFMETIVYLFFPMDNNAYVFAANYQYLGNTTATVAYLIWNLYLAGQDRLASNKLFQAFLFACPIIICTLVFTNDSHQLFYTKLVKGQPVSHGPMFAPCLIWSYLISFAGYLISIVNIVKTGQDKGKRLFMFSLFPVLPMLAVLVRTLSGIDKLDYTPIIMAISFYCLYLIVFKYNYVNIIPSSIEAALEQTSHPIGIYDPDRKAFVYSNRIAKQKYADAAKGFHPLLSEAPGRFEGVFDGKDLKIDAIPMPESSAVLVTVTDMSEVAEQQALLDSQIKELESLSRTLEEKNRNIDAYLGSLYRVADLKQKQDLITHTYEMIRRIFEAVESNLKAAKESPGIAAVVLEDNLHLTRKCIHAIRETVAQLREV